MQLGGHDFLISMKGAHPVLPSLPLSVQVYIPEPHPMGLGRGAGGEDTGGQRENRDEKHAFLKDHFLLMIHIQRNLSIIGNQRALLGSRNMDLVFLDVFPSQ